MGCNTSISLSQITDGASNTILLGELRIGLLSGDRRGTWAMGSAGASSLFGHGTGNDIGPNAGNLAADGLVECPEIISTVGKEKLASERMGCTSCGANSQATMRSRHPGGVNVCLCDGSVRFIADSIEKTDDEELTYPTDFHVWERLNASADGLPIDPSKL
jgi:prepilin-type processing-associated H-X9-DG protein